MTDDRIQIPCLDESWVDVKRIYDYRQVLERFKQDTKRKYEIDTRQLIKEETITEAEWNAKEEETHQDFLWEAGPEATHQILRSPYQTEPDKICRKEKKQLQLTGRLFWAKQTDTETPE